MHRENFASALKMVRQLDRDSLAAPQRAQLVLLEGQILRSMGLPQEAVVMFNHELGSIDKRDQLAVQREARRGVPGSGLLPGGAEAVHGSAAGA